ncbi:GNAT family N-acetyltransferase [Candidatus Woesebacteria bacterium]|nr:MAG: GNAT family N-acetyltransferase [Candidatus Woesebacteria bacterium]
MKNHIELLVVEKLTADQQRDVAYLQKIAFPDVSDEEDEEDFYHHKSAHILAYLDGKLVGWAGIHETEQIFEEKRIKLGGYGICTHPNYWGKGIAGKVSQKAMDYLTNKRCEVGFLSVDFNNEVSLRLHKKHDFVMLHRKFSWTNSKGELKKDTGGMIAPISSRELFKYILEGKDTLYVGNGYW